jgi:hypothetical protein
VDLDAIKTCSDGIPRRLDVFINGLPYVFKRHLVRHVVGLLSLAVGPDLPLMATAEGATSFAPGGRFSTLPTRPACINWIKILPPLMWTLSVTSFHATVCSGEKMPGMRAYPNPLEDGDVPSVIINPAPARWR